MLQESLMDTRKIPMDVSALSTPATEDPSIFKHIPLNDLSPAEVFERMYVLKHGQPPTDSIMTAFATLLVDDDEREDDHTAA